MNSFVNYLIESGISLSLFALIYFLILRKETFFNVNRWFLLVSVVFSAVLPLLHIPFYAAQPTVLEEVTVTPYVNLLSTITVYGTGFTTEAEHFVLSYSLLGYIYLAGVIFFAIKLCVQIIQIFRLIVRNDVVTEGNMKLVFLDREMSPFSFLNYVFVSKNLHETKGWEKMLEHEQQHIRQGHTFDVLMLEIIAIVQWFNPFFWMFRRALRENHEFLADQAVISQGTAPSWYKQILINQYVGDQIVIANNFNHSLIKTRIKMMSRIKSKKITYAKILLGVVLAGSLTASFAFESKNQGSLSQTPKTQIKNSPPINEEGVFLQVDQMPEYAGGPIALREFLATNVKYPEKAAKKGIQGKVYVNFIVEVDGSVVKTKVVRSVDPELDAEAIRVVKLTKWSPGKQNGKAVRVSYTVPINFALQ